MMDNNSNLFNSNKQRSNADIWNNISDIDYVTQRASK